MPGIFTAEVMIVGHEEMVLEILAYAGQVDSGLDTMIPQVRGGSNAGQHEGAR